MVVPTRDWFSRVAWHESVGPADELSQTVAFTIDTLALEVRILDSVAALRLGLSEPAKVTLVVNGDQVAQSEPQLVVTYTTP